MLLHNICKYANHLQSKRFAYVFNSIKLNYLKIYIKQYIDKIIYKINKMLKNMLKNVKKSLNMF